MRREGLSFHFGKQVLHLPSMVLAFVIGGAGGWAAKAAGFPLPWLLGSLLTTAALALGNVRPFGHILGAPTPVRMVFIPVIGVSIGTAFTPELLQEAQRWWPTLLALFVYIPVAHLAAYAMARRLTGIDGPTAYYGTMPGGFIESQTLGEAAGADGAMLITLQFLRLVLCLVLIPVGFTLATGHAVGSAAGEVIGGGAHGLTGVDWGLLAICGVVGAYLGQKLHIPAGIVTGPILVSGAVHFLGLVEGGPPRWLIDVTQLVMGVTLGTRFAGRSPRVLVTGLKITAVTISGTLVLTWLFAISLHGAVGERWEAVFLAFAPGGLAEMSLIALSLEISVIYVTAHHVLRIILAVSAAKLLQDRVLRHGF